LAQRLTSEATILAFNDVFRFVAFLALATAAYILYRIIWIALCVRRTQAKGAAA
jgi:hypothetical protein